MLIFLFSNKAYYIKQKGIYFVFIKKRSINIKNQGSFFVIRISKVKTLF